MRLYVRMDGDRVPPYQAVHFGAHSEELVDHGAPDHPGGPAHQDALPPPEGLGRLAAPPRFHSLLVLVHPVDVDEEAGLLELGEFRVIRYLVNWDQFHRNRARGIEDGGKSL